MQRNNKTNRFANLFVALACVLGASVSVHAAFTDVAIGNPSFEINSGALDNANPVSWDDWTSTYVTPVFNPSDLDWVGTTDPATTGIPDGTVYTMFVFDGSSFEQTLTSESVAAGAEYKLSFYAGDSARFIATPYLIELETTDGDSIISEVHAAAPDGAWEFVDVTGFAPGDATGDLTIRITDTVGGVVISFFDTFKLEVDAGGVTVPAPAALPAGLALIALAASRRHRHRR